MKEPLYSPPWKDVSIIGIAGSSGSGKTSLAVEIVSALDRPWVVILSMDSYYKSLTAAQLEVAFKNEYDFDSPDAIDFDTLVENLQDLKHGRKAEIPTYSFQEHQRQEETTRIYSARVVILEGIFALYDQRVQDLLDIKIFAEADADTCLARRIVRDVKCRGRDIEGVIKQWFSFVKPNFERYVDPQRKHADIIVPRGIENKVAIDMVVKHIQHILNEKSKTHTAELKKLGQQVEAEPLSRQVILVEETPQMRGMSTILQDQETAREEFIFQFDRISTGLIEHAMRIGIQYRTVSVETPQSMQYNGLVSKNGAVSAVVILRAGSAFETGLKRVIPDCCTGRLLIQSNYRTGEPELHYLKLPPNISSHGCVLLLDPQMSSGGAALMAVSVLLDHGVPENRIVFVTFSAGKIGVNRLCKVFPGVRVVLGYVGEDFEDRWIERRYFGC